MASSKVINTVRPNLVKWTLLITLLILLVILSTFGTLLIVSECRAFIICDQEFILRSPFYWTIIVVDLIILITLVVILVHLLRVRKKWNQRRIEIIKLDRLRGAVGSGSGKQRPAPESEKFENNNNRVRKDDRPDYREGEALIQ